MSRKQAGNTREICKIDSCQINLLITENKCKRYLDNYFHFYNVESLDILPSPPNCGGFNLHALILLENGVDAGFFPLYSSNTGFAHAFLIPRNNRDGQ